MNVVRFLPSPFWNAVDLEVALLKKLFSFRLACVLFYGLIPAVVGASGPPKASASLKNLEVTDIEGAKIRPLDSKDNKAVVLIFIAHDCPIANSYAPEINLLCNEYAPKKVAFYLVYTDLDYSLAEAKKHAKAHGYKCPAILDASHKLVKVTHAAITPEAFVISPEGKTLYQGRIDDRYIDFGKQRHQPSVYDLRLALDAIVEGRMVATPKTRAVGCFIPDTK